MSTPDDDKDNRKMARAVMSGAASEPIPCHDATILTAGGTVARIFLNGQSYALRITRQGKLILTK
jgi:hemin uptake protein HemP